MIFTLTPSSILSESVDVFLTVWRASHQVTISEHLPAGSAVITVTATDCDFGENGKITYRVKSSTRGVFYIDPSNGKFTVCTIMVASNPFMTRVLLNHLS